MDRLGAVGWRTIPSSNIVPALLQFASIADPFGLHKEGLQAGSAQGLQGAQTQLKAPGEAANDELTPMPSIPSLQLNITQAPLPGPAVYNIAPPTSSALPQQQKQEQAQLPTYKYWNQLTGSWYETTDPNSGAYGAGSGAAPDPRSGAGQAWYNQPRGGSSLTDPFNKANQDVNSNKPWYMI